MGSARRSLPCPGRWTGCVRCARPPTTAPPVRRSTCWPRPIRRTHTRRASRGRRRAARRIGGPWRAAGAYVSSWTGRGACTWNGAATPCRRCRQLTMVRRRGRPWRPCASLSRAGAFGSWWSRAVDGAPAASSSWRPSSKTAASQPGTAASSSTLGPAGWFAAGRGLPPETALAEITGVARPDSRLRQRSSGPRR